MAYYATYMPNETGELQKVVINAGVGFVLPYYGETAPPGTLACDGSEISRVAYGELFAVLGTKAGAGDGSTTFNLPDLRGDFLRWLGGNSAALGVQQGDAIRDIQARLGNTHVNIFSLAYGAFEGIAGDEENYYAWSSTPTGGQQYAHGLFAASKVVPTAIENRPINIALLPCIIYE